MHPLPLEVLLEPNEIMYQMVKDSHGNKYPVSGTTQPSTISLSRKPHLYS